MKKNLLCLGVFLLMALASFAQSAPPLTVTIMKNSEVMQGTRANLNGTGARFRFKVTDPTENTGLQYEFGKIWITPIVNGVAGTSTEYLPATTVPAPVRAFALRQTDLPALPEQFSLRLEGMTRIYPDGRRESVSLDPAGMLFFVSNPH